MSAPSPYRVLIADDEPAVRSAYREFFGAQRGFTLVAEVGTGTEAVELYAVHRPDVVLMDLQMPGMSGIDAIGGLPTSWSLVEAWGHRSPSSHTS